MSISQHLVAGFASLMVLFGLAVGTTCWQIDAVRNDARGIVELDAPRSQAAAAVASQVNDSLSTLRSWLISGDPARKQERAANWEGIDATAVRMNGLVDQDAGPEIATRWRRVTTLLGSLRAAEDRAEATANTPDEQPAATLLSREAMPLFNVMGAQLTAMMDEEATLEATPERKELLRQMAEFRGPLGLSGANLRAYLTTGDDATKKLFASLFGRTRAGHDYLVGHRALLTATQSAAMDKVEAAWVRFQPLPERLFAIRESEDWNVAQKLMRHDVLPLVADIRKLLVGDARQASDARPEGDPGIVGLAARQLHDRSYGLTDRLDGLRSLAIGMLGVGLVVAGVLGVLTTRAIVRPLRAMTSAMGALARRDLSVTVPGIGRGDEIGGMAAAVQVFKEGLTRAGLLATEQAAEYLAKEERARRLGELASGFEGQIGGLVDQLSARAAELEGTAQSMTATAGQTDARSAIVAGAAEEASVGVQTVAAAAEELAASIAEITRQVTQQNRTTNEAAEEARRTDRIVRALAEGAQRVGEVVSLISAIAGQTNLLAA